MSPKDQADSSLEELVHEFGLTSEPSNLDALRSEVKARISELHTDHKTTDPTSRLQGLTKVLKMTGKGSKSLQPIKRNVSIAKPHPHISVPEETVETRLDAIGKSYRQSCTKAYLIPKISLGTLSITLGWAFLFPQSFTNHPFIGPLLKNSYAPIIWLSMIALLAIAWLTVWWREGIKKRQITELLNPVRLREELEMTSKKGSIFSVSQFRERLYPKYIWYPKWIRLISNMWPGINRSVHIRPSYDSALAERIAELAIERFIQKGWIVKTEKPDEETSIDDWYKVV